MFSWGKSDIMLKETTPRARRAQAKGQGALQKAGLVGRSDLLTVRDAARLLGVGKSAVYQLIRARRIRSVQIPGRRRPIYRIPVDAIEEFIERHTRDVRR